MAYAALLLALLFFSCGKHSSDDLSDFGKVTFLNESSYSISIRQSFFSGSVLIDKLVSGDSYTAYLSPSNNYGAGSVFSIEYWYLVASEAEFACGDVWTGGIDPNVQISQNIEAGKEYIIQIPQPKELKLNEAFFKIQNTSSKPFELNHLGTYFKQAGNGELSVPNGKVGIYRIDGETEIEDYTITQGFNKYPFPQFTAKNGYIYVFEFNGSSVKQIGEQKIIF